MPGTHDEIIGQMIVHFLFCLHASLILKMKRLLELQKFSSDNKKIESDVMHCIVFSYNNYNRPIWYCTRTFCGSRKLCTNDQIIVGSF